MGSHYSHPSIDRTIQDHRLICINVLIRVHCSGHVWIYGLEFGFKCRRLGRTQRSRQRRLFNIL